MGGCLMSHAAEGCSRAEGSGGMGRRWRGGTRECVGSGRGPGGGGSRDWLGRGRPSQRAGRGRTRDGGYGGGRWGLWKSRRRIIAYLPFGGWSGLNPRDVVSPSAPAQDKTQLHSRRRGARLCSDKLESEQFSSSRPSNLSMIASIVLGSRVVASPSMPT